MGIFHTVHSTFPRVLKGKILCNNQELLQLVISFILVTLMSDSGLILFNNYSQKWRQIIVSAGTTQIPNIQFVSFNIPNILDARHFQGSKEFLFATSQLLTDHLVCCPVFCITMVTSNFSDDLKLNTQFKSVENMNYEQLITKNNSLLENCSFVVFPFFLSDYVHPIQQLAGCEERLAEFP